MNKERCRKCKHYFQWKDICLIPTAPEGYGLIENEACSKLNKELSSIKRCNGYEEVIYNKNEEGEYE